MLFLLDLHAVYMVSTGGGCWVSYIPLRVCKCPFAVTSDVYVGFFSHMYFVCGDAVLF